MRFARSSKHFSDQKAGSLQNLPLVIRMMGSLGEAKAATGNFAGAEADFKTALDLATRTHGKKNKATIAISSAAERALAQRRTGAPPARRLFHGLHRELSRLGARAWRPPGQKPTLAAYCVRSKHQPIAWTLCV
jgi:hypothetical protein